MINVTFEVYQNGEFDGGAGIVLTSRVFTRWTYFHIQAQRSVRWSAIPAGGTKTDESGVADAWQEPSVVDRMETSLTQVVKTASGIHG